MPFLVGGDNWHFSRTRKKSSTNVERSKIKSKGMGGRHISYRGQVSHLLTVRFHISYHFVTSPFTFPTKLKLRCHISYIKIAPTVYSYWLSWPNLT